MRLGDFGNSKATSLFYTNTVFKIKKNVFLDVFPSNYKNLYNSSVMLHHALFWPAQGRSENRTERTEGHALRGPHRMVNRMSDIRHPYKIPS